ncbi:DUF6216 family protein [Acidovorax sp. NCPPB 3859]|uniref:DUF6216 family protein n=1 Tax=Paracidovorax avenae TaxID=80867 RepID=UPI0012FDD514|nr:MULTISPECIES: DUF6216 family protein [Comamonadaceae]MDA8451631.1 DUF6216 family protein [Acidovorax sp. GBBC 3297]MDA8461077.1 DUF6216 family protein [Acidovorax sp. GBBC 3333]MDA8466111.1 DUF6216 family protein [Acidovorax sp. GBBC 3332]MDA8471147.1 DUF6216 family protein [Acidovorax sp. GBBC 3299]WCM78491.1 DUF6216 family protein [Acidovorax sp. GBBC 712]
MTDAANLKLADIAALAPIILGVGLFLAFVFTLYITKSLHMLRRRLWSLVHGKDEISDSVVRAYVDELTNVSAFRFFSGVSMRDIQGVHDIVKWCQFYKVDLKDLRDCGEYFDFSCRRVVEEKLPGYLNRWMTFGSSLVLLIVGAIIIASSISPSLGLVFTESQRYFFARETYVRRIWASEDEKFVIEDCQKSRELEAVRTGFHIDELNLICKFMPDKSFKNYYSEKLAEQRAASVIFGMIFIISAWFVLGKLIRYTAAMKLLRRRLSPHVSAGQMELDFGGADQK